MDNIKLAALRHVRDCFIERVKLIDAEIAEAEKPKLRHGDCANLPRYGFFMMAKCFHDIKAKAGEFLLVGSDGITNTNADCPCYTDFWETLLNPFDDFKAMVEPLKRFTMKETTAAPEFSGTINKWTVRLANYCHGTGVDIGIQDIPAFILQLRRLVATAEQEQDGTND